MSRPFLWDTCVLVALLRGNELGRRLDKAYALSANVRHQLVSEISFRLPASENSLGVTVMKYAFMSFSTPDMSLTEMLAAARKYGYDGVEPRLDSNHAHGVEVEATPAQREAIAREVADSGVRLACLATSSKFADPDSTSETIAGTRARIELAGDLGVPALRVFGGPIPEGLGRDKAIDLLVRSLGALADPAAERDVIICLETHDDWCDPNHVAAVLERVGHPAVQANWDIMHPVRVAGTTIDEAFRILRPWIRHVHFHDGETKEDGKLQLRPIGEGIVDHRRAVELLKGAGYDGFLSGEWIRWEAPETHLPRERAVMKRYEEEA